MIKKTGIIKTGKGEQLKPVPCLSLPNLFLNQRLRSRLGRDKLLLFPYNYKENLVREKRDQIKGCY